ncbi:MAG: energy transducer TonB [Pseudomonadota bacterium]
MRKRPDAVRILAVVTCLGAALAPATTLGDFRTAVKDYAVQNFSAARAEFEALAALGDGAAQFNLGAMYLRGDGIAKDRAMATGWMVAAASNGYAGLAADKLSALHNALSPADLATANGIIERYGHAALEQSLLPPPGWGANRRGGCGQFEGVTLVAAADRSMLGGGLRRQEGIIEIEFTVGTDGLVHDTEVGIAYPKGAFDVDTVRSVIASRYAPATLDGVPVPSRYFARFTFKAAADGVLWAVGKFAEVVAAAEQGLPEAQFLVGSAALLDATLRIPESKAQWMVLSAAQGGQPHAQYWVARSLTGPGCGDHGRASLWFEEAARRGDPAAAIVVAERLVTGTPAASAVERAQILLASVASADDPYALRHALALAMHPAMQPANLQLVQAAALRLDKVKTAFDPQDQEALAAAAAVGGDFAKAVSRQQTALSMARDLYWNTSQMEERLARYTAHQSFVGELLELPPRTSPAPPLKGIKMKICQPGDSSCDRTTPDEKHAPLGSRITK